MQKHTLLNARISIAGLGLTLLSAPLPLAAQEVKGASAFLKELKEFQDSKQEKTLIGKLIADIRTFSQKSIALPPAEAAKQWLVLLDRYFDIYSNRENLQEIYRGGRISFNFLLAVLPPTTAWSELTTAILARKTDDKKALPRENQLRLFAYLLKGDRPSALKHFEAIRALDKSPDTFSQWEEMAKRLKENTKLDAQGAKTLFENLRKQLQQTMQGQAAAGAARGFRGNYEGSFPIPDLVKMANVLQVEPFIRELLTTSTMGLDFPENTKTFQLAQRLALDLAPQMRYPQWNLACTLDSAALYEVLEHKFPPPPPMPKPLKPKDGEEENEPARGLGGQEINYVPSQRKALCYYLLGQAQRGNTNLAIRRLEAMGVESPNGLFNSDFLYTAALSAAQRKMITNLLRTVLQKNPNLAYWEALSMLGGAQGDPTSVRDFLKTALQRPNLKEETKEAIDKELINVYFNTEQIEEGVVLLRKQIAATEKKPISRNNYDYGALDLTNKLTNIGRAMKRKDWVVEGNKARKRLQKRLSFGYSVEDPSIDFTMGQAAEIEKELIEGIQKQVALGGGVEISILALVNLYHKMGRYQDVLLLIDRYDGWGRGDLAQYLNEFQSSNAQQTPILPAAKALAKTGRTDEAKRILEAALLRSPSKSEAYALLIELGGAKALPFLETLCKYHPKTQEPWIWKARLFQKAGNISSAEKSMREAFSLSPSMETYYMAYGGGPLEGTDTPDAPSPQEVLAEILEAKGDKAQATKARVRANALRLQHEARGCLGVGLRGRALALYQKAASQADDIASIYLELASMQEERGNDKEAEALYQKGYTLLPNDLNTYPQTSFPFYSSFLEILKVKGLGEKVLENVLARLLVASPKKPEVHYILATLRNKQRRYTEALTSYRKAIELNPQFVVAWQGIISLPEEAGMPSTERENAFLTLIRLSPSDAFSGQNSTDVWDFKRFWESVASIQNRRLPDAPTSLYPLAASQINLQSQRQPNWQMQMEEMEGYNPYGSIVGVPTPGKALARIGIFNAINSMLESLMQKALQ